MLFQPTTSKDSHLSFLRKPEQEQGQEYRINYTTFPVIGRDDL